MSFLSKIHEILSTPLGNVYKTSSSEVSRNSPFVLRRCKDFDFEFFAPDAQKVSLTGEFVNWDPTGIPMEKDISGVWHVKISLTSGRYEYKFIVDGIWQTDPTNPQTSDNSVGSQNSVKQLTV